MSNTQVQEEVSVSSEADADREQEASNSDEGNPSRISKLTAIAAAIAAVASAIAASLVYVLMSDQNIREARLRSMQQLERFEERLARLGHPINCVEFLASVTGKGIVENLLSTQIEQTSLMVTEKQVIDLSVCLSGLEIAPTLARTDSQGELGSDTRRITIEPEVAAVLRGFSMDFVNAHDTLYTFSRSGVGDSEQLDPYIVDQVFSATPLHRFLDFLCQENVIRPDEHYIELIKGINSHNKNQICQG